MNEKRKSTQKVLSKDLAHTKPDLKCLTIIRKLVVKIFLFRLKDFTWISMLVR